MSDQQPAPYPAQMPGAPWAYAPPQARGVSAGYRRWAGILSWLAIIIAVLVVVAFVASLVLLVRADADVGNAAYGYLAIFLWFGIAAAIPVLLAVAIPGAVMTRRVRRQRQAGITPW
jgi:heme/copper-type cytochrome/quinol oxidase subunit 2